ncbi:hypothetical protein SELMODRAFT_415228 [Selaginella moellendorffii]|uniref:F-box domain-containing protein n=1 Tax=Selaginella moellendorffii TaxID=88036 RepID=D8RVF2_SELML|nr:hypothetical protein SELMODRAFT_415228 [Selaginella moellendorffii]
MTSLSPDLELEILSWLSARDAVRAQLVCKAWAALLRDDSGFKALWRKHGRNTAKTLLLLHHGVNRKTRRLQTRYHYRGPFVSIFKHKGKVTRLRHVPPGLEAVASTTKLAAFGLSRWPRLVPVHGAEDLHEQARLPGGKSADAVMEVGIYKSYMLEVGGEIGVLVEVASGGLRVLVLDRGNWTWNESLKWDWLEKRSKAEIMMQKLLSVELDFTAVANINTPRLKALSESGLSWPEIGKVAAEQSKGVRLSETNQTLDWSRSLQF